MKKFLLLLLFRQFTNEGKRSRKDKIHKLTLMKKNFFLCGLVNVLSRSIIHPASREYLTEHFQIVTSSWEALKLASEFFTLPNCEYATILYFLQHFGTYHPSLHTCVLKIINCEKKIN